MSIDLSIVIPVYNEVENLAPLQIELERALSSTGKSYEIIYVDDGSHDGSVDVLKELAERNPNVVVICLARNYGQTAAMAAGFDHSRGAIIVTLDADGQNDPADIPRMLDRFEENFDLVAGWRLPRHDAFLTRRVPSVLANTMIGWITGVRLHDYGCTLKAMRADIVRGIHLYGEMHRFIPAMADDLGARITEMVVHHRPRRFGTSKYGLSRTIRVLLDLITVKFLSSYSTRPIQIFGGIGLIIGSAGLLITGVLGMERLLFGVELANRPLVWLGILLTLMGMQFVTMGLLGELLVRTYHESQNKPVYRVGKVMRSDPVDTSAR